MSETTVASLIGRLKARYAANAASPDGARTKQVAIISAVVGVVLLGGYRLLHRASGGESYPLTITPGVMPACDSSQARRLLKRTLEQAPAARQAGITVAKLGAFRETGFVPVTAKGTEMRLCTGDVFFSAGRQDVAFTLQWTSPKKDELWIEADDPY